MKRLSQIFFALGFLSIVLAVVLPLATSGADLTTLRSTFVFAGPVVCVVVFFIAGAAANGKASAKEAAVIRETQPLAYAKVLPHGVQIGAWDSDDSRYLFVTLRLQFVTEKREIIITTASVNVALSQVHAYKAGNTYGIRYNPESPRKIMFDELASPAELEAARLRYIKVLYGLNGDELQMRKDASRALGVIMEARPTGNIVNDCGEMVLTMNVTKENGGTFTLCKTQAVPQDFLEYTIPGNVLPVYYFDRKEQEALIWFYDEKVGAA